MYSEGIPENLSLHTNQMIRKAIWGIPVSGLLFCVSILLRGKVYDPAANPQEFIRFATAPLFQAGATWNLFNFVVLFAGVLALCFYLVEHSRLATAKMALGLLFIAHCLTFCYLGQLAFIYNKTAMMAGSGNPDILSLFDLSKNSAILPVVIVNSLSYLAGVGLLFAAMWKSKLFSRMSSLLLAVSFVCVGLIPPAMLSIYPDITRASEMLGNVLLVISGLLIAKSANQPS